MAQRGLVTYHPNLATDRLAHLHHSRMCIYGYVVSGGSYFVCIQTQFGLGSEWSVTIKRERV